MRTREHIHAHLNIERSEEEQIVKGTIPAGPNIRSSVAVGRQKRLV